MGLSLQSIIWFHSFTDQKARSNLVCPGGLRVWVDPKILIKWHCCCSPVRKLSYMYSERKRASVEQHGPRVKNPNSRLPFSAMMDYQGLHFITCHKKGKNDIVRETITLGNRQWKTNRRKTNEISFTAALVFCLETISRLSPRRGNSNRVRLAELRRQRWEHGRPRQLAGRADFWQGKAKRWKKALEICIKSAEYWVICPYGEISQGWPRNETKAKQHLKYTQRLRVFKLPPGWKESSPWGI